MLDPIRPGHPHTPGLPHSNRHPHPAALRTAVIGLALALGLAGCRRQPPITVQTEKVARRTITETVTATGKIQPFLQVKISPEVAGEIIELPVKEGQRVRKGDLLVRIKRDFYEASRNSAEANRNSAEAGARSAQANVVTAEANARKAEAEFVRHEELFARKLVSESIYDDLKTARDTSRAQAEAARAQAQASRHQVQMAEAALKKAEEDLLKTTIVAPIEGTVSKLNTEVGERVVGTGMMAGTEIMTIADLNDMEARVEVGEVDIVRVALGQGVRLEVDSFKTNRFSGTVTQIANSAKTLGMNTQQESTKFEVRIRIREREHFRPGMSVTADIETASRTNVLSVPLQSVTSRIPRGSASAKAPNAAEIARAREERDAADQLGISDQKRQKQTIKPVEVVFTLAGNKVRATPVRRGISDQNYYEILSGLDEGQEVVSGGYKAIARELEEDRQVKVDNEPKKTPEKP